MRILTPKHVREHYGGSLPADAILGPDDDEVLAAAPPPGNATGALAAVPKCGGRIDRFGTLNAFVDVALADLTRAEANVWLVLFRDVKAETGTVRTGQADIARRAGVDPRSVRRALDGLKAKGMVRVIRRGGLSAGPSVYTLHPTGTA